jgi:hypothetical protein
MKLRFWRKSREGPELVKATRDSEAQRAKERALLAQREARTDLAETEKHAQRAKDQRTQNHFGPMIYDAMRPK